MKTVDTGHTTEDAHKRLCCAILLRAVKDVQSGNGHASEARSWLLSDDARNLCDLVGLSGDRVKKWVMGG